jgi:leucyl/phenylalanyl-tRNA--protein transferase
MLEAYRRGIFPMPIQVERRRLIAWLAPDPRGILEFGGLRISRRLQRRLRQRQFEVTFDQAFARVLDQCAAPRGRDNDCWLTLSMQNAYQTLHDLGHAHSVEVWQAGQLVGGIFGIAIGGLFAGESMFSRVSDASKAGLAILMSHLAERGFSLFDVQWTNDHTRRLGAIDIPRSEYLRRLAAAVMQPVAFGP